MTVITTEKLGADRRRRRSSASTATGCSHDDALPGVDARGARGQRRARVPRPPPRRRDPGGVQQASSGRVEMFGKGEHPEIFRVTLDPAKNPSAAYLRGTFDWHIDGCTDDIPIMATLLSAHAVADSGGETEFASSYAAYDDLDDEEKDAARRASGSCTPSRRRSGCSTTTRRPRSWRMWRSRPPKEHPLVWTPPLRSPLAGARRHHRPRRRAWTPTRAGRSSTTSCDRVDHPGAGLPPRLGGRRPGHLGQPRRAAPGVPLRPDVAPRHAPHDPRRRRADPVSDRAHGRSSPAGRSGIGLAISERLAADGIAVAMFDRNGEAAERGRGQDRRGRRHGRRPGRRRHRPGPDRRRRRRGRASDSGRPTILVNSAGLDGFDPFLKITVEKWNRILDGQPHRHVPLLPGRGPRHDRGGLGPHRQHLVVERAGRPAAHGALRRVQGRRDRAHQGARARVRARRASRSTRSRPASSTRRCCARRRPRACSGNGVEHHESDDARCAGSAPEDIAAACAFLVRDEASYITGQVIGVNGGWNT